MATDILFYKWAVDFPDALFKISGIDFKKDDFIEHSINLKSAEKRLDAVFIPENRSNPVIFYEFMGYWDELFYISFLKNIIDFCHQEKYKGKILAIAVFTEPSYLKNLFTPIYYFENDSIISFKPRNILLKEIPKDHILAFNDVSLIPILPLCNIENNEILENCPEWSKKIQESKEVSDLDKKNLLTLLAGFLVHRLKDKINLIRLKRLMGGFMLEDTLVGQELIEMGIQKGKLEGKLEGKIQDILDIITIKFEFIPDDVEEIIKNIKKESKLTSILHKVAKASSIEEIREFLKKMIV